MIEQEWLESEDPVKMLRWIFWGTAAGERSSHDPHSLLRVSDGRLRSWADAAGCPACDKMASGPTLQYVMGVAVSPCNTKAEKSALLRCVVGNPFRRVSPHADWLTPTVLSLAQAADEERIRLADHVISVCRLDPARLAVLSDALEEAGCNDADILTHLRGPGPHVRSCWAVDSLLGKQ